MKGSGKNKLWKVLCLLFATTLVLFTGCDFFGSPKEDVVTISRSSAEIAIGETLTLTATSSEGRSISWYVEDENVAVVDDSGVVRGIGAGTTEVYADDGKAWDSCTVNVTFPEPDEPPESDPLTITLSSTSISMVEGGTFNLIAKMSDGSAVSAISWTTGDSGVATVTGTSTGCTVTAVGAGETAITATLGDAKATCNVTVAAKPPEGKDKYPILLWGDEFNGNSLDKSKWGYQIGTKDSEYGGGPDRWGNNELQYYTNSNDKVSDGILTITARREHVGDCDFTSTRITTRDKFSFTYGYIEARMKLPTGKGMWPAFWLLPQPSQVGSNSSANANGTWASSGELDILEVMGTRPNIVMGTVHYGGTWPGNQHSGKEYTLESSTVAEWHTYGVEWTADYIKWYVDDYCYSTINNNIYWSEASPGNPSAPFDQPFYILLNLAVDSGSFDPGAQGGPNADFTSADMQIDYVRVYQ